MGNRITGKFANGIAFGKSVNTTIAKNHVAEVGILVDSSSHTKIVNNVVRNIPEDHNAIEVTEATNTTIEGNDLVGNWFGLFVGDSTGTRILANDITDSTLGGMASLDSMGTKILANDVSRSGNTGITIFGPGRANNDAKVVGNHISRGPWGIWVGGAHHGSFAGNTIHDNCAGMFFEAFQGQPVGGFEVKANTVENNTRKCPTGIEEGRVAFSGIGIALLGASGMEVTANHLSGNVPSGPTRSLAGS